MVGIGMSGNEIVNLRASVGLELSFDGLCRAARTRIDDHGLAVGKFNNGGVSLSNIKEPDCGFGGVGSYGCSRGCRRALFAGAVFVVCGAFLYQCCNGNNKN